MIKLGKKVRDTVSGFEGVAVSSHEYLQGCRRISIQPKVDKEGKLPDTCSFDEPQLEYVDTEKALPSNTKTGGPEKYMPSEKPVG